MESTTSAAPPQWLDRADAATYLGCTERQLKRWTSERRLTSVRLGQRSQYRRTDLDAFIAASIVEAQR